MTAVTRCWRPRGMRWSGPVGWRPEPPHGANGCWWFARPCMPSDRQQDWKHVWPMRSKSSRPSRQPEGEGSVRSLTKRRSWRRLSTCSTPNGSKACSALRGPSRSSINPLRGPGARLCEARTAGAGDIRYHITRIARREGPIADLIQRFGWKAFVTNATQERLSLADAVLCYRNEYRIERIFNRLKSRVHIAPLFVKRDDQIRGSRTC